MDEPSGDGEKPVARRRCKPIYVWADEKERAAIEAQAKLHGQSLSSFLRLAGMGYKIPTRADREEAKEIAKAVAKLSNLGGLQKWYLKTIGDGDMAAAEAAKSVLADIKREVARLKTYAIWLTTPRIDEAALAGAQGEPGEEADDDLQGN